MISRACFWAGLAILVGLAAPVAAGGADDAGAVRAITKPSEDATLSFTRPGWISEVLVKPGDVVKKGQLLIQMDDRAEQAQLKKLKAQAEDTTRIRAAVAKLNLAGFMVIKIEWAFKRGAVTEVEVEEKRLEMTISELSLELARFQNAQDKLEYEGAKVQLERMKLVSPIDGVVEQVVIEEGESADASQKLIQIVRTDPLWADVPVPSEKVRLLKLAVDGLVIVRLPGAADEPVVGRIIHTAMVSDAGSRTRIVRVELPNIAGRPAGEIVRVLFPEPAQLARSDEKAAGVDVSDVSDKTLNEKE